MVRVRTATSDDVPAISDINVRGWQAAYRGVFPDEFLNAMDPRRRHAAFAVAVTSTGHHTAVAFDDDVIGFVGLRPPEPEDGDPDRVHEIWGLYVEPTRIGTGVGRELMSHALDYLSAGGWEHAILWTLRDVARTCRFYEVAGWHRDGAEKVWDLPEGNPVTLVRYRFNLVDGANE
ncbi:MAG TPA: GNAT family N-acetyltransferase [Acidimicrobiia bacterium]|nr:GNAT family N-acetyltransferase [Acidimicrobiia bacterium]